MPQYLWLGPDKHTRFKLYATPPEHGNEPWALPYSIRSFVAQASAAYPGCRFQTSARGEVMGETVFEDTCAHVVEADGRDEVSPCHMVMGWTTGTTDCAVWSAVAALIAFKIADLIVGLRVPEDEEREGLDITSHGESAYHD